MRIIDWLQRHPFYQILILIILTCFFGWISTYDENKEYFSPLLSGGYIEQTNTRGWFRDDWYSLYKVIDGAWYECWGVDPTRELPENPQAYDCSDGEWRRADYW